MVDETAVVTNVKTSPFEGQKPGTSGLRKKVKVFQQPHYLENFVQSVFNTLAAEQRETLVVGGDGRYFNDSAIQVILRMAIANGFSKVIVGVNGLLSTPAASHLIRKYQAVGGLVLSASHNPAGPDEDFGIKFNNASGSPAPESVTQAIFENTQTMTEYFTLAMDAFAIDSETTFKVNETEVSVVDSVVDYVALMQGLFDFDKLKQGFADGSLSVCFDAMHAVTGPYARAIFEDQLGAKAGSVINAVPLTDFGGGHPDPNLVHAKQLIALMAKDDAPLLGAASDGDGDRNLITGQNCFISPSDSLAAIALNAQCIPQFKDGLTGVARSMPTSTALDRVAQHLAIPCFETPTGWKFFGNLLDAEKVSLCGEESFGTSGDHVREKDGIWAVLCWLSILAATGKSPQQILEHLWQTTGRSFYCRHDYEGVDGEKANDVIDSLTNKVADLAGQQFAGYTVESADIFCYRDPVDDSVSDNQGVRVYFEGGSRVVFRLSGTGTDSATIRVYLEKLEHDAAKYGELAQAATEDLGEVAKLISEMTQKTGKTAPSVIT
ncbi:MAG: alpha-D-glucose phosphate-specific phosphoglucomutase [Pseudomonadales bacterium]|nr:alpha-D-glucose phosphate-specific phosphoglucomutase [Pseudomonadales bacterium]